MRAYDEIFVEGKWSIIQTRSNRYILDYATIEKGSLYATRRIRMLTENYPPYDMYPLNIRLTMLGELFNSKKRNFIDCYGKLVSWKPTAFYKITCHRIIDREINSDGDMLIKIQGISSMIRTPRSNMEYVRLVTWKGIPVVYDFCDEHIKDKRKKI